MYPSSPLLQFAEDKLQIIALLFMATVYALKIRWILGFPAGKDRQAPRWEGTGGAAKGARTSLLAIAMPWTMASTRNHVLLYAQFVIFHLGVAGSIAMSFVIPYAPGLLSGPGRVAALQTLFVVAALVGVVRMD